MRCVLVLWAVAAILASGQSSQAQDTCPAGGDDAVAAELKPILRKHQVPAMAALVLTSKGIESIAVVGVRKRGAEIPATLNDLWHLGSDTKAMTATVVGSLVEKGLLKWDANVADLFPDIAAGFHPNARRVTMLQLLSHRAGLPANLTWAAVAAKGGTVQEQRAQVVRTALSAKPEFEPGSKFQYSNLGYVIVGAIIERVTGQSWEDEMRQRVFRPLEMSSAGFGGTGTPGQIDQPWPHRESGRPADRNGPSTDNPPVMGPAGTVHCTIRDWAKFVADQLRGRRGAPALLGPATYRKLQTPPFGGDYALGWIATTRNWAGGAALNHGGSNTMNYANVWIAPERDFAILVCVNQGGDAAFKASDEAVAALIKLHAAATQPATSRPATKEGQ